MLMFTGGGTGGGAGGWASFGFCVTFHFYIKFYNFLLSLVCFCRWLSRWFSSGFGIDNWLALGVGRLWLCGLGLVNVSESLFGSVHSTGAVRFSGGLVKCCLCELTFGVTFTCSLFGLGYVLQ